MKQINIYSQYWVSLKFTVTTEINTCMYNERVFHKSYTHRLICTLVLVKFHMCGIKTNLFIFNVRIYTFLVPTCTLFILMDWIL